MTNEDHDILIGISRDVSYIRERLDKGDQRMNQMDAHHTHSDGRITTLENMKQQEKGFLKKVFNRKSV